MKELRWGGLRLNHPDPWRVEVGPGQVCLLLEVGEGQGLLTLEVAGGPADERSLCQSRLLGARFVQEAGQLGEGARAAREALREGRELFPLHPVELGGFVGVQGTLTTDLAADQVFVLTSGEVVVTATLSVTPGDLLLEVQDEVLPLLASLSLEAEAVRPGLSQLNPLQRGWLRFLVRQRLGRRGEGSGFRREDQGTLVLDQLARECRGLPFWRWPGQVDAWARAPRDLFTSP